MNRFLAIILVCGAVQVLHGQVLRPRSPLPDTLATGASYEIHFSGVPPEDAEQANSQTYTVAADGSVTLPWIGPVVVAGLSMSQAEKVIERTYVEQKIYRWPTITINAIGTSRSPQLLDAPGPGYRGPVKPARVALAR